MSNDIFEMISLKVWKLTVVNWSRTAKHVTVMEGSYQGGLMRALMLSILLIKKLMKLSPNSFELSIQADCEAFIAGFTILKTRGL